MKSPLRTTAPGRSPSAWLAAIFSTSVRPISVSQANFLAVDTFEQQPSQFRFRQILRQRRLYHFAGAIEHLRAHEKTFLARTRHDFFAHHEFDLRGRITYSRHSRNKVSSPSSRV